MNANSYVLLLQHVGPAAYGVCCIESRLGAERDKSNHIV